MRDRTKEERAKGDEDEGVPLSRGFPIKEVRRDEQREREREATDQKSIASSLEQRSKSFLPETFHCPIGGNIRRPRLSFDRGVAREQQPGGRGRGEVPRLVL